MKNNSQALEFNNGSQIKAIPTSDDAGRSEALSLLIVDEAAFVRNFDKLYGPVCILHCLRVVKLLSYQHLMVSVVNTTIYGSTLRKGKTSSIPIKLLWDVHPERDEVWFE